jgi:leucyl/phenylalanyl-tRNA---protein transferase
MLPWEADEDGIVGAGADLDPTTLVGAYRNGVFPWPHGGLPLLWFSPDPRCVFRPGDLVPSQSLRRTLRRSGWTTTMDEDLPGVVRGCADRADGTWITPEMRDVYLELGALGWVHSLEVWDDEKLVGGIYGVLVGGVFTGESMFHVRSDASKVALLDLLARMDEAGGTLVDAQVVNEHLMTLGGRALPREEFVRILARERDRTVLPSKLRLPVSRLVAG